VGACRRSDLNVVDGWDAAKLGAVGSENFDTVLDLDASNAVATRRLFSAGFDEVLAKQSAVGNATWYDADKLGSVRKLFDDSGTVTASRDYAAFGAIMTELGAGLDRYAFTSREWDAAIGLQYSRSQPPGRPIRAVADRGGHLRDCSAIRRRRAIGPSPHRPTGPTRRRHSSSTPAKVSRPASRPFPRGVATFQGTQRAFSPIGRCTHGATRQRSSASFRRRDRNYCRSDEFATSSNS